MRINEFRRHVYLAPQWRRELQTNGILQAVLEVLESEHPSRFTVKTNIQDDLSPTNAALQLGFTRGYSAVLNTIRALAEPLRKREDIGEPNYEEEKQEEVEAR